MPLDHFTLVVPPSSLEGLITFLSTSFKHMGFQEMKRANPTWVGMGDGFPFFWINAVDVEGEDMKARETVLNKTHIALTAKSVEEVQQFHAAALEAGGTCNGPPGLRAQIHPGYYAAFVRDPACGINFEAVFHGYKSD